jgi:hypothetical protein
MSRGLGSANGSTGLCLHRIREWIRRRHEAAGTVRVALETAAAVITIVAVVVGSVHHFQSSGVSAASNEGKQVVAFRQIANRICAEHQANLHRALQPARNRVDRLDHVARALDWDVKDLESVIPPPSRSGPFVAEISVRRRMEHWVLALQQAAELHDLSGEESAIAALEHLGERSRELGRLAGAERCGRALPRISQLVDRRPS